MLSFPPRPPTTPFSLPADHFLALPPTHFSSIHPAHPPTLSLQSRGLAPNTSSTAAADFDVDVRTGFLPPAPPVMRLKGEFEVWEKALDAARGRGESGQVDVMSGLRLGGGVRETAWRMGVDAMPTLSARLLQASLPDLRRAHLVLTFLLHFYVHSHPTPATPRTAPLPIPASISVPLLSISPLLGLPPILTYSDTVLYNSHPINPSLAPSRANPLITSLETFTNTPDEAHFFLTSARCELIGVKALTLMRKSMDEAFMADNLALTRLAGYLRQLAIQIDLIGDVILDVRNGCRPEVFYHLIRPWFKGGDSDGPDSAGWLFLGVDEAEAEAIAGEHQQETHGPKARKFSGPSAGQSTLIHSLDVFLMVDHAPPAPTDETSPTSPESPTSKPVTAEQTFMNRMTSYMPHPHRSFLTHLAMAPHPIRSLVLKHAESRPALAAAYDEALSALKRLREKHMRVVTMYIIQMARRGVPEDVVAMGAPVPVMGIVPGKSKQELGPTSLSEFIEEQENADGAELRGTGGTALIKFLKMCRDNTVNTMVGSRPVVRGR